MEDVLLDINKSLTVADIQEGLAEFENHSKLRKEQMRKSIEDTGIAEQIYGIISKMFGDQLHIQLKFSNWLHGAITRFESDIHSITYFFQTSRGGWAQKPELRFHLSEDGVKIEIELTFDFKKGQVEPVSSAKWILVNAMASSEQVLLFHKFVSRFTEGMNDTLCQLINEGISRADKMEKAFFEENSSMQQAYNQWAIFGNDVLLDSLASGKVISLDSFPTYSRANTFATELIQLEDLGDQIIVNYLEKTEYSGQVYKYDETKSEIVRSIEVVETEWNVIEKTINKSTAWDELFLRKKQL